MADTNLCDGCSSGMSLLEGKHYDRHGFAIMSCQAHKYAATPPADAALADEVTENLVALVGRLSHQLSKATPGHRLPVKAMAYLEQIGFKFHVARHGGPEAATQGKEPETIWRWYALDHTGYCYGANPPSNLPERCCLTAFHRHMDATEAAAALRARAVPEAVAKDAARYRLLQRILFEDTNGRINAYDFPLAEEIDAAVAAILSATETEGRKDE